MTDKKAPENEAEILFPDRDIVIGKATVTVREFGFKEGMRLTPLARPIIEAMGGAADGEHGPQIEALNDALIEHPDELVQLMAAACDRPTEWIEGLSDSDGQNLLMLFWSVNSRFFTRRLVIRRALRSVTTTAVDAASTPGDPAVPDSETSTAS